MNYPQENLGSNEGTSEQMTLNSGWIGVQKRELDLYYMKINAQGASIVSK